MYLTDDEQKKIRDEFNKKPLLNKVAIIIWTYLILAPIVIVHTIGYGIFKSLKSIFQFMYKLCKRKCRIF